MHYRAVAAFSFALAAVSCGTNEVSVDGEGQLQRTEIQSGESLSVVNVSSETPEDVLECLEHALYRQASDLSFVSSNVLRDALFPWFEPSTAPGSVGELTEVMSNAAVRRRIRDFNLRYVIALSGGTREDTDSWGGCFGGYAGAGCVGGLSLNKRTELAATILDVKYLSMVGELAASGSGTSRVGMLVIVPYVTVSPTESNTCDALARRIGRVLRGGPEASGNSRELLIAPAAPR